jgi:hypothetical protein
MTRLAPWLRHAAFTLGPLGLAGLALSIGAPLVWWFVSGALQAEAADQRREIARVRARQFAQTAAPPAATPARQLDAFRAAFPGSAALPEVLAAIARTAGSGGVALPRGEYKLADEPALGMLRYELRHPVKGGWREIFGVIAALLNEYPYLSLDEVVFKRESRAEREVEAQLHLSLYFIDGAGAALAAPPAPAHLHGTAAQERDGG